MNITRYMKEHTELIKTAILKGGKKELAELRELHRRRIEYMQHERLVHLLVTLTVAVLMVMSLILMVIHTKPEVLVLLVLLLVLLIPYIFHYFFLENTVQEWYKLMDEIEKHIK